MNVTLRGLVKRFRDGTEAVRGIDLDIAKGEFLTLLGPSGCGKTTTLRLIAGLEEPTEGSIAIDPGDRDVAMVFQTYALYPHMTALQNMTLGLTVAGMSKAEQREGAGDGEASQHRAAARAQAGEALGRRAPARRPRPRHGAQPRLLPDGRAALQPRPQAARAHADRAQAPASGVQGHDHLRDPRPGRGADPLRRAVPARARARSSQCGPIRSRSLRASPCRTCRRDFIG
ncbi:sn-glycerol-3-phosphate import ATP-binding protein UgpC [Geodia barretti]|uniref:Sn-glycerol-3-phosphate import ATP-binding protein UgpC n=1 Tax=Geodia barretti TaxID=519541 RepID=A0AA35TG54_GEOBA|nr:sn-glycerol-3-phosphate import ATP-binding protein UgpC [Geodia barretti]